jgi:hypothetical protein
VFVREVGEALGCGARGVELGCWQCIFFGPSCSLFVEVCECEWSGCVLFLLSVLVCLWGN